MKNFKNRQHPFIFVVLTAVFILLFSTNHAIAAVELISFEAESTDDGIILSWETGSEIGTAGFVIERFDGTVIDEIEVEYNDQLVSFIPGSGDAIGSTYEVIDYDVNDGQEYAYILREQEIDSSGLREVGNLVITYQADGGSDTSVGVSVGSGGSGGGSQTSPTNTPRPASTPTNTPQPTATQASQGSAPTATPPSSNTGGNSGSGISTITPIPTNTPDSAAAQTAQTTGTTSVQSQPTPTLDAVAQEEASAPAAVAVASAAEDPQQGYPEPEEIVEDNSEVEALGQSPELFQDDGEPADESVESYVGAEADESTEGANSGDEQYVQPIGAGEQENYPEGGSEEVQNDSNTSEESTADNNNRILLWGSFITSMFIFLAGIIGAIVVYRRRQN